MISRRFLRRLVVAENRTLARHSLRRLHTTQVLLNLNKKHEHNEERLNKEIKKLKKLREEYAKANFFQKFRLQNELFRQEAIVAQTQATAHEFIPSPVIRFDLDAMDLKNFPYFQDTFSFMLAAFKKECEAYSKGQTTGLNPDLIIQKIIEEYSEEYPGYPKLSKDEVLFYFHIYYSLLNNIVFVDELKFDDPDVARLLADYSKVDVSEDIDKRAIECAKALNIDEGAAICWFNVFSTLSSTPFAKAGERMTCSLCPEEYARYELISSEVEALQKNISQMFGKKGAELKSKDDLKGFSFKPNKQSHGKNEQKEHKGDQKQSKEKKPFEFEFNLNGGPMKYFQYGVLGGLVFYLIYSLTLDSDNEISFQQFTTQFLKKNLVSKLIIVNNRTAYVELNDNGMSQYNNQSRFYFNIGSVESFEKSLAAVQDELKIADELRVPVIYVNEGSTAKLLINFLPTLLFLGAIYYMTKKANIGGMGGPLSFGKSTAKKFNQETDVKVRFKDVAGMTEAKQEIMEFVTFLKHPEKYEKLGAKIPRGAILSGPPGTGKTLIARATAGEAGVPFYSVSGSEFVEMFVGVGASRVRDLFKTARENAPSIVFVDEIDAIGKQRSKGNASGANDERETTLNQLLVEMDGFESSDHVVVLAGTNRADILDRALMRPGRFDRHITIDNPELEDRKQIFGVHLRKITLDPNIDKDLEGRLAALTPGFSGADIANVCNEAALIAARYNAKAVTVRHFELAIERVIGGIEKKSKLLSPEEQKIVAYHEAGHAVCGWFLKYAYPLLKVSIIPRGQGALGYAQYLPPDQYLMSVAQLMDRMVMTLGGRVSEELHFKSVTGGAHDDFKKVTNIAQSMVLRFGMSKTIGMVNYADTHSSDDLTKPFSDETNRIIDEEVKRIVNECHQRCTGLLKEKEHAVDLVAQELLRKEYITREDMIRLLGKRPFPEINDAFDKYLDGKDVFKNDKPTDEKKDLE